MFSATSNAISNYIINSTFLFFLNLNYMHAVSNRKVGPGTGGNHLKMDGDSCKVSSLPICVPGKPHKQLLSARWLNRERKHPQFF